MPEFTFPEDFYLRPGHVSFGWQYRTYYNTPNWKAIKKNFLQRNPVCYGCGEAAETVHHAVYTYKNMSGLDESHLYPVCLICHKHSHFDKGKKVSLPDALRRLKQRREILVIQEQGQIYIRARMLHAALDMRLTFLIEETI